MNTVSQQIVLHHDRSFGGKLPPHYVGLLLALLPLAIHGAVSMALRNRSSPRGKRPEWLKRATDVRFVDFQGDEETMLYFEAPRLGEAAEEMYQQGELWPTLPDPCDTGFDLLGDVLADVEAHNEDSERFDLPLLKRLTRFKKVFEGPFREADLISRRYDAGHRAHLSPPVIETAEQFFANTPEARRVRMVGTLDMVRFSNQTFGLKLDSGEEVRCVLVDGDIEQIADLRRQPILVFGSAVFRVSGRVLRLDVDEYRRATEADNFFAKMPKPADRSRVRFNAKERQKMAEGLKSVIGKWPGDETDEQIEEALREIS